MTVSEIKNKQTNKQWIKGAFSAVFDAFSFLIKNIFFLKEERPFLCGITHNCLSLLAIELKLHW